MLTVVETLDIYKPSIRRFTSLAVRRPTGPTRQERGRSARPAPRPRATRLRVSHARAMQARCNEIARRDEEQGEARRGEVRPRIPSVAVAVAVVAAGIGSHYSVQVHTRGSLHGAWSCSCGAASQCRAPFLTVRKMQAARRCRSCSYYRNEEAAIAKLTAVNPVQMCAPR